MPGLSEDQRTQVEKFLEEALKNVARWSSAPAPNNALTLESKQMLVDRYEREADALRAALALDDAVKGEARERLTAADVRRIVVEVLIEIKELNRPRLEEPCQNPR